MLLEELERDLAEQNYTILPTNFRNGLKWKHWISASSLRSSR